MHSWHDPNDTSFHKRCPGHWDRSADWDIDKKLIEIYKPKSYIFEKPKYWENSNMKISIENYGRIHTTFVDGEDCSIDEYIEGNEEGVEFFCGNGPQEVMIKNNKVQGLRLWKCLCIFDDGGKFNPEFDQSCEQVIEGEQIFIAIGQSPDYDYIPESLSDKVEIVRGKIKANDNGQVEKAKWLFVGGDILLGPDLITGVADGHRAAQGIDEYLYKKAKKSQASELVKEMREAAILNTTAGPIYIGKDAEIMEGSVVRGPLAMCEHSALKLSTKVYGPTTLGPHCKVGGEVNNVVFQAYSNKGHDGFLGNAVLGEWCNIGADSNNSNLKNNYEEVRLWSYETEGFARTGLQFCGLMMGDHSKCGINTMFNTGTVVGVSANIFGSGFPRNFVPSFSWGGASGFSTYLTSKAFQTARIVMARRQVEFTDEDAKILEHVFEVTKKYRKE